MLNIFDLGEEKPYPFISLDIDRQVEGKVVTTNNMNIGAPNSRIPISSNYQGTGLLPLPSFLSQAQTNTTATLPTFILDGGVYQGQPPSSSQSVQASQNNTWNSNQKVI